MAVEIMADRLMQVGVHGLREYFRSRSMRDLRSTDGVALPKDVAKRVRFSASSRRVATGACDWSTDCAHRFLPHWARR